jgi:hypothetical protein
MNPNTTWSSLLERYYPYLPFQKVSKNPQTYCIHNTLPKNAKSHFGYLCPSMGPYQLPILKIVHTMSDSKLGVALLLSIAMNHYICIFQDYIGGI